MWADDTSCRSLITSAAHPPSIVARNKDNIMRIIFSNRKVVNMESDKSEVVLQSINFDFSLYSIEEERAIEIIQVALESLKRVTE